MTKISRENDDDGLRWYTNGDVSVLSVTTILDQLDVDESGLDYWKDQNDGVGDAAHHHHIYWYAQKRGTLCHYQALSVFEDHFDEGDDMWGGEEGEAMESLTEGPHGSDLEKWPDDASTDLDDITYSIMVNQDIVDSEQQYEMLFADSTRLIDLAHDDQEWFIEAFHRVCDTLGVDDDSVIRVEKYMVEPDVGYGGQCDLVYEDENGDIVVADLKTSGSLRWKNRLQAIAYSKAVERAEWGPDEVDRVEVWRLDPDDEEVTVHSHTTPEHAVDIDWYTDEYWFDDKWGEFEYESNEEMWEHFQELAEQAQDAAR